MRSFALVLVLLLAACPATGPRAADPAPGPRAPTGHTPLVTGNGFGFAVYSPSLGGLAKLYAHPYSFMRPDPASPLGEGIETPTFIKQLRWDEPGPAAVDYLAESHVIVADRAGSRQTFFMPFGLARHALVTTWEPRGGNEPPPALCPVWAHTVTSQRVERVAGSDVTIVKLEGVAETLVAIPLAPEVTHGRGACFAGRAAWALASLEDDSELAAAVAEVTGWQRAASPHALVEREIAELEAWRVKPAVTFGSEAERRLWRQSEVVLRMAQSREPDRPDRHNHGLILAVLPDGGWVTPWVRDMAYAIHALIAMGHQAEARAGIEAYFRAQPVGKMQQDVGGAPYQISVVRYFGDGSEEPFFTQEGSLNVELDNWGLVLWVLGDYVAHFHDPAFLDTPTYRGTIYDSAKQFVVAPLVANLEPYRDGLIVRLDTSIWEERQKDAKHFAFSTIAAIAGLRGFDALATLRHDEPQHAELGRILPRLDRGFAAAFASTGRIRGTLEPGIKNDVDGAVLSAINLGVATDPAIIAGTAAAMPALEVASGGYRRVHCILDDPKIFEYWYERQEFLFVDFSLAEVYLRMHHPERAAPLLATIVDKAAADRDIIPEMYVSVVNPLFKGAIGEPTGAIPMVGYGAGAYISYLIERQALGYGPTR